MREPNDEVKEDVVGVVEAREEDKVQDVCYEGECAGEAPESV